MLGDDLGDFAVASEKAERFADDGASVARRDGRRVQRKAGDDNRIIEWRVMAGDHADFRQVERGGDGLADAETRSLLGCGIDE